MKINKIKDQLEVKEEVELQSCWDDCTEYLSKTKYYYNLARSLGFKCDGTESLSVIRDCINAVGYYCVKRKTPKTNIYW